MLYETYKYRLEEMQRKYPEAVFIDVTRSAGSILAPSWNMLNAYKKDGDWDRYTQRFTEEMQHPDCQAEMHRIGKLAERSDVFLVCFEGPRHGRKCHRFLLIDMINELMKGQ